MVYLNVAFGIAEIVGERGIRVSGGQRQRIGIARALQGFKTILIVAHRLSTVQHCDRVYRIEDATIVGEGTLEELTKSAS